MISWPLWCISGKICHKRWISEKQKVTNFPKEISSGRKKREENALVTMTDHSLLKCPSFIEGIYNAIFQLHACICCIVPNFSFLTLVHLWLLPSSCFKLPLISHLLSLFFFFPHRIALFHPLSNPSCFSETGGTGIPQENKPRKSLLPWGRCQWPGRWLWQTKPFYRTNLTNQRHWWSREGAVGNTAPANLFRQWPLHPW